MDEVARVGFTFKFPITRATFPTGIILQIESPAYSDNAKNPPKKRARVSYCSVCRVDCSLFPNMFYNIKKHFVDVNKMIIFAASSGG